MITCNAFSAQARRIGCGVCIFYEMRQQALMLNLITYNVLFGACEKGRMMDLESFMRCGSRHSNIVIHLR